MSNEKGVFQDNRTLFAVVLTMGILFGWQFYLQKKYPQVPQVQQKAGEPTVAEKAPQQEAQKSVETTAKPTAVDTSPVAKQDLSETLVGYEDSTWSFQISSYGMGIRNLRLKSYKDRQNSPIILVSNEGEPSFETRVSGKTERINFAVTKENESTFVGRANLNGQSITKTIRVNSNNFTLDTQVEVSGPTETAPSALAVRFYAQIIKSEGGGMFAPPLEKQTIYLHNGTKPTYSDVSFEKPEDVSSKATPVGVIGSHYFATGIVDNSGVIPNFEVKAKKESELLIGLMEYPVLNRELTVLNYQVFAGPKATGVLKTVDTRLADLVDFGWFSVLGYPILALLKWIYSVLGNYGLAIIFLTLIVRMLVLPFNVMSYKSMKAMQLIQPQMQAVREKYKEDPQRMNLEVMNLMKVHKVNPLGGCLPVLLQLPVFFALYRVLGESIELYQAPFGFWIQDLSLKDPFYVLPILMGISMYVQQKITPTTMDPAQAKVMQFMPILFAFMMVSLPSGLTLYIFVSTLFGIIQQKIFMRDTSPGAKTIQVTT